MKRSELIADTRRLVAEGERLQQSPSVAALRVWLQLSDELLSRAWGQMDRYHLAWLTVGRSETARRRKMTTEEEDAYVREVAAQKTAVLQMSLKAIDEQNLRTPDPKKASWAGPDEIAATFRFLASNGAAAINGARIPLTGRA